jgi:hypothetical protein
LRVCIRNPHYYIEYGGKHFWSTLAFEERSEIDSERPRNATALKRLNQLRRGAPEFILRLLLLSPVLLSELLVSRICKYRLQQLRSTLSSHAFTP